MFGSRRRHTPHQPLNASTVDPNAATAALSAFKRRGSNASLSAAAAAAALRSRPTTPIDVSQVQTKRTMRRSTSVASASSAVSASDGARRPPPLQRRGSSGSMTERTFRTPSPHRPGSSRRGSTQMEDTPPVPSLPRDMDARPGGGGGGGGGQQPSRPKSLGFASTPLKLASQTMREEASGSWFRSAKVGDPSNVRTSDAALANAGAIERPGSRGSSVNFSYPARVRIGSPPPTSPTAPKQEEASARPAKRNSTRSPRPASISSDMTLVYDPNSRRMVPRAELLQVGHRVHEASEKPRPKKKQVPARAGSYLAHGSMGRTQGTAVDVATPSEAEKAAAASLRYHRAVDARAPVEERHWIPPPRVRDIPAPQRREPQALAVPAPPAPEPRLSALPPAHIPEIIPSITAQPTEEPLAQVRDVSVAREEPEPVAAATGYETGYTPSAAAALDAVPMRQTVYQEQPAAQQQISGPAAATVAAQPIGIAHDTYLQLPSAPTPPPAEPPAGLLEQKPGFMEPRRSEALQRERSHSNSPARTAHFGPVNDSLTVRHSPPPRSVSPRKSALKPQSPSRGGSPTGDSPEAQQEGSSVQRRRSVRVSFDDENTQVVGRAASPESTDSTIVPSPQTTKRIPWLGSIGRGKKKDFVSLDEDEIMKPRPALPSFGSVREKKQAPKEPEERPLVRPLDAAPVNKVAAAPSAAEADTLGQSSDHALGSLLQEQGSRNAANISKYREPLPPVVTSVEGTGYGSDSSNSSDSSELYEETPGYKPASLSQASTMVAEGEQEKPAGSASLPSPTEVKDFASQADRGPAKEEAPAVPEISITQPSPGIPHGKEQESYLDVPGSFPETDSDHEEASKAAAASASARQVTFEPVVQRQDARSTAHTPGTVLATQPVAAHGTDESEGSEVFSDAYEDLSEIEGDGFLSLDAVVESPLATAAPKSLVERPRAPQKQGGPALSPIAELPSPFAEAPDPADDWEKAKAYWRSLTADKRAQLEKEAWEEAGTEGDLEEEVQGAKKPRRKKSVEKRAAEKKAIQLQKAIKEEKAANPDRTYMIRPGTRVEADALDAPTKATTQREQQPAKRNEGGARLRKSMRGAAAEEPSARATEGVPRLRTSMRGEGPARQQRPASLDASRPAPQASKGHARTVSDTGSSQASSRGVTGIMPPPLTRRGSDSSTSSFKRARGSAGEGGFGFRRTMRPQSPASQAESARPGSSRFSLRSLSPTGSAFRRTSVTNAPPPASLGGGMGMRSTLRASSEGRNKSKSKKGSRGGFGRSKKKSSSRFDDSSDEDVAPTFRSRFDDSSDEDVTPAPLPPLVIPRNKRASAAARTPASPTVVEEDEQSSDLPDSDDEKPPLSNGVGAAGATSLGTGTLRRSRSGRGELGSGRQPADAATNGAARPPASRRNSILSVLRRKKHDAPDKISRSEPRESAARRDTKLERTEEELRSLRSDSWRDRRGAGAGSPKLQKRAAALPGGAGVRNDSWPLPDEEEQEGGVAAGGEDGAALQQRPALLQRRTLSTQGTAATEEVGGGSGKKKKKFGALRRMFRLDD